MAGQALLARRAASSAPIGGRVPEAIDLQLKVNVESEGELYLDKAAQTQCRKQAKRLHKKWQPAWPAVDKATIEKTHLQGVGS